MQISTAVEDFTAPSAEWKSERLDSWKEIAGFFRREVRTVQLWEKNEHLPIRRQHHKKLGSVYAYRRELENWWITRAALSSGSARIPEETDGLPGGEVVSAASGEIRTNVGHCGPWPRFDAESNRILLFPFEVVHSWRDRGPLQQIVDRFAAGLKDDLGLELKRSHSVPICLGNGALPAQEASSPAFLRNAAREFGVNVYLTGAVRYAGNEVRVSVQLVRSADSVCLWSERFDNRLDNVFSVQVELARKIAQAIPEHMVRPVIPSEDRAVAQGPAYHAYMTGRYFWKQRTTTDLIKAVGYFQDAIQIDPGCADAYAGLADTYVSLSFNHAMSPRLAMRAGQDAVAQALELAPDSRNAHNAEINFNNSCTWNWTAAERRCKQVVDSATANSRSFQLYSGVLINLGRHDEAITLALHGHRLEPFSDSANSQLSYAYFYAGDYGNAIAAIKRSIELKPQYSTSHAVLGRIEAQRGNWDEAIQAFENALQLSSDRASTKALLAYGYAGRGDAQVADRILRELEQENENACFPAVDVSAVYTVLRRENEAMKNLIKAYRRRDIKTSYIAHDPRFRVLRSLPQFKNVASSIYCPPT